jgi:hypothetical protein
MTASVFFDAFAECVANVACARKYPPMVETARMVSISMVVARHGQQHAEATGRMFDRLWQDMQNPKAQP